MTTYRTTLGTSRTTITELKTKRKSYTEKGRRGRDPILSGITPLVQMTHGRRDITNMELFPDE